MASLCDKAETPASPSIDFARTPSTVCSSPQRHLQINAAGRFAALVDAEPAEPAAKPRTRPRAMPFASLGLPAWALEKAANAPVETCEDCSSWYSPSPCSSCSSPRSFALEPSAAPATTRSLAVPSQQSRTARLPSVSWADLVEEEDSSGGWPTSPAAVTSGGDCSEEPGLCSATFVDALPGSSQSPSAPVALPGQQQRLYNTERDHNSIPPSPIALTSAGRQQPFENSVSWADLAEEEDGPSAAWPPLAEDHAHDSCNAGMLTDGDVSTDASDHDASDHGGSCCSSGHSSPSSPTLGEAPFLAYGRDAAPALPTLLTQRRTRRASWADLVEEEDDGIFDAWPALPAADALDDHVESIQEGDAMEGALVGEPVCSSSPSPLASPCRCIALSPSRRWCRQAVRKGAVGWADLAEDEEQEAS